MSTKIFQEICLSKNADLGKFIGNYFDKRVHMFGPSVQADHGLDPMG